MLNSIRVMAWKLPWLSFIASRKWKSMANINYWRAGNVRWVWAGWRYCGKANQAGQKVFKSL